MRMQLLQLEDLGEVAEERPGARNSTDGRQIIVLKVSPRVRNRASIGSGIRGIRRDISKGIDQVRELFGRTVAFQCGEVVAGVIDTPFLEIPGKEFLIAGRFSEGGSSEYC